MAHPSFRNGSVAATIEGSAGSLAMVAVCTLLGLWIAPRWGTAPVDMIYLPAVLVAGALWGLGPALAAGAAAALAYNFFFTEPIHTFRMDRVSDVVTMIVLLIVALVTSRLAAGIRNQARIAAAHAERNATIAGFARRLLSCSTEQEIAETACTELNRLFDCNAMLVSGAPVPRIVAAVPDGNRLTPSDIAAAALTIETGEASGRGTARIQPAEWQFQAVRSTGGVNAAIGLARDDGLPPIDDVQLPLLTNLLDQVALALARVRVEGEAREVAGLRERDRIRSTLLASIRQELGPPIASIISAARQLRRGATDKALTSSVASEAQKLDRYVSNLLEFATDADQRPVSAGDVAINLSQRTVSKRGEEVHLTPKEFAVLAELARHPGQVLSHAHLLRTVWGPARVGHIDYLRVAIRALRQKLEADPSRPTLIINEPAVGYRLIG
jgi:two-component system, OmpR family, sensor histidine kinase KdpD